MNFDESFDIIRQLAIEWTQVKDWPDEKIQQWVQDIQELDYGRATQAVRACRETHTFPPAWAEFSEAYRTVTYQALAPERQTPRPAIGAGYIPANESAARVRALRGILAAGDLTHDHRRGIDNCPICRRHEAPGGIHRPEHCVGCKKLTAEARRLLRIEDR